MIKGSLLCLSALHQFPTPASETSHSHVPALDKNLALDSKPTGSALVTEKEDMWVCMKADMLDERWLDFLKVDSLGLVLAFCWDGKRDVLLVVRWWGGAWADLWWELEMEIC